MWWNSLSVLQQVTFVMACAVTAILVVQIILMLIGNVDSGSDGDFSDATVDTSGDISLDGDVGGASDIGGLPGDGGISDIGGDFDVDGADVPQQSYSSILPFGLKLISLRSILAFLAIGSWMCYTFAFFVDWYFAVLIAVAFGFAASCGMAGALVGMEKLQSSGNINPGNAVGKAGSVYLTIPPSRSGKGKVNVLVQERYAEYEAITDCDEAIPTGAEIKIKAHVGGNILLVERLKKPNITITEE
ncbi:MAG: hypothetical protein J1G04_02280 [Clostridiales bacterium]|nr:hypothetical protein [Clostridiales bacterium]